MATRPPGRPGTRARLLDRRHPSSLKRSGQFVFDCSLPFGVANLPCSTWPSTANFEPVPRRLEGAGCLPWSDCRIADNRDAAENATARLVRDYRTDAGGRWSVDRSCRAELRRQAIPESRSQLSAPVNPTIRSDCGFLGETDRIGQGPIRDAHVKTDEGDLDIPPDEKPAGGPTAARAYQAGKHGALPRHRGERCPGDGRADRGIVGGDPVGVNGR
jgi:hypothetical protein